MGLAYRSTIDRTSIAEVEAGPGSTPAKVSIELPDTASLAISHQATDKLQILADYTWTGWSSIPRLKVQHGTAGVTLTDEYLGFKDSYRVGLGMQYQYTDALRCAQASPMPIPVRNAADRTVRLRLKPHLAGNRLQLAEQADLSRCGYAHLFFDERSTAVR